MKTSQQSPLEWLTFATLSLLTALVLYPILFCFLLPILIYRQLVILIVRVTDLQCQEILTGMSAILTGSQPYKKPPLVLVPYLFLDGHVNVPDIIRTIENRIIKRRLYPELKQKIVRKFGYHFWKSVENFNLENHVRYFNPDSPNAPVLRSTVRNDIAKALSKLPFDNQHSPWEIVVVPNVFDPDNATVKSAVLFRLHHALMDGGSGMKLVEKLSAEPWSWVFGKTKSTKKTKDTWQTVKKTLQLLLSGPYYAIKFAVFSLDTSEFLDNVFNTKVVDWRTPKELTKPIPISNLKEVTRKHDVGMFSVITTLITVGAANFMRKKCDAGFSKLPEKFILHMVFPLPGHPDNKLSNWWTTIRLPIRMEETRDAVQFSKKIHVKLSELSQSVEPLANHLICAMVGLLPIILQPDVSSTDKRQTVMLSNFPGPKETVNIFGANIQNWTNMAGGSMGTAFVTFSQTLYDEFSFDIGAVTTIYEKEDDVNLIQNCVLDDLKKMRQGEAISE